MGCVHRLGQSQRRGDFAGAGRYVNGFNFDVRPRDAWKKRKRKKR